MQRRVKVLILPLILAAGLSFVLWSRKANDLSQVAEVPWSLLATVDAEFLPSELRDLMTTDVRVAGFVVPLSDSFQQITEFLLVPDSMSCIHVPPPPSNQMIMVRFQNPIPAQLAFGAVWVAGRLRVERQEHEFGTATFVLDGAQIQEYRSQKPIQNFAGN